MAIDQEAATIYNKTLGQYVPLAWAIVIVLALVAWHFLH